MKLDARDHDRSREPEIRASGTDLRMETGGGEETAAEWRALSCDWPGQKAALTREWSLLTDEDIEGIDGNRRSLLERLHARYGWTADECETQLENWMRGGTRRFA